MGRGKKFFVGVGINFWGGNHVFPRGNKIVFSGGNNFLGRGKKIFFLGGNHLGGVKKKFLGGGIVFGEG